MAAKKIYSTDIRWGILGCGNVTEVKSGPAYKQVDGFQLAAVMRRDADKLKDYAQRHNIAKYYSSAEELINDSDIDAVYIATPPDSHKYYALQVAAAGKPCCIEKPLSPCYQDSLTIYEAFKNKDIPLFVAYYRRSLPRFQQVKTWLDNNAIGDLRHISWKFSKAPNTNDLSGTYNWRTDVKVATGGYFDDLASHGLDLFTYLLGDVKEVYGISENQQQLYLAKDTVSACWIHKTNVTGTGFWNFGCERTEDTVELFGSKGKITFSVFEENPLLLENNGLIEQVYIDNPQTVQLPHVENMKRQLFEKEFYHPSNGATAVHTSWIMDKILGENM